MVIGKLTNTMKVYFRPKMAMFGPRGATSLKMHRGKLINVMIGLAEPMRERVTQSSTFL
jgi:hypothetical protein